MSSPFTAKNIEKITKVLSITIQNSNSLIYPVPIRFFQQAQTNKLQEILSSLVSRM